MTNEQCGACYFWAPAIEDAEQGYCVVNPPSVLIDADNQLRSAWPVTARHARCGAYKSAAHAAGVSPSTEPASITVAYDICGCGKRKRATYSQCYECHAKKGM